MSSPTVTYENGQYYTYSPKVAHSKTASYYAGMKVAGIASAAVMATMPLYSKPFTKQIRKEHSFNIEYYNALVKAYEKTGLKDLGLKLIDASKSSVDKAVNEGTNAFYSPNTKSVVLNLKKASASGFHEFGHALNNLTSKGANFLQKLRAPGIAIASLMGTVALFSRFKPEDSKDNFMDMLQKHCGEIAFVSLLPMVAEEGLASYKGIKMAKEAGLSEKLLGNLKKLYGKALLSYLGYAVATGLSVFVASRIMEYFTKMNKVEVSEENYFSK